MKNINELDVASFIKNIVGDTGRNVLTSIPGVGTAVGVGSSIKNFSELNDDLEKYKDLKRDCLLLLEEVIEREKELNSL